MRRARGGKRTENLWEGISDDEPTRQFDTTFSRGRTVEPKNRVAPRPCWHCPVTANRVEPPSSFLCGVSHWDRQNRFRRNPPGALPLARRLVPNRAVTPAAKGAGRSKARGKQPLDHGRPPIILLKFFQFFLGWMIFGVRSPRLRLEPDPPAPGRLSPLTFKCVRGRRIDFAKTIADFAKLALVMVRYV